MTQKSRPTANHSGTLRIALRGTQTRARWKGREFTDKSGRLSLPIIAARMKISPSAIKCLEFTAKEATFSSVRKFIASANVLAWQLGVRVNGKRQARAEYEGKPNITYSYESKKNAFANLR